MYIAEILSYLSWPFMIIVSYQLVKLALRQFEKQWAKDNAEE